MEDPEHDHHHVTQTKITEQEKKKRGLEYTYLSQPCDNRYDRRVPTKSRKNWLFPQKITQIQIEKTEMVKLI